jgi:hypothetical protein
MRTAGTLSTVPADAVLLLADSQVVRPGGPTEGRDSNAILREVLGVSARPEGVADEVREVDRLIDGDDLAAAQARVAALERRLGWQDEEVVWLRTRLEFLQTPLAPNGQVTVRTALSELNERHTGPWTRVRLERELKRWRPRRLTGPLPMLCEVVAQEIDRRLRKAP